MARIKQKQPGPSPDVLNDMYWNQKMTMKQIAGHYGVGEATVWRWMNRFGIPRRSDKEAQVLSCQVHGRPKLAGLRGSANPNWRGGITFHTKGYILRYEPGRPDQVNGYVFEHRLVAEQKIGRRLLPSEDVHHLDGDKTNNDPRNLVVVDHGDHQRLHHVLRKSAQRAS